MDAHCMISPLGGVLSSHDVAATGAYFGAITQASSDVFLGAEDYKTLFHGEKPLAEQCVDFIRLETLDSERNLLHRVADTVQFWPTRKSHGTYSVKDRCGRSISWMGRPGSTSRATGIPCPWKTYYPRSTGDQSDGFTTLRRYDTDG